MATDAGAIDDPVGAFVHRFPPDQAPTAGSDRPLAGVRLVADDLLAVAGLVTGAGNPDWRRTHEPEPATAPALDRLIHAGATLAGTTVVDELGLGTLGINVQEGTPVNPVAPDSVPGGSGRGAAAVVAAGMADAAVVADSTGGARVPASVCGLYGLRLSPGRVPLAGLVRRSPELDALGIIARDASVLWQVVRELLGTPVGASGEAPITTLVLAEDLWSVADDEVVDAMVPQLQRLALRVGVRPLERLVVDGEPVRWAEAQEVIADRGAWDEHGAWFTATNPTTALDVKQRLDAARALDDAAIAAAHARRTAAREVILGALAGDAALVLPTTPAIAPLLTDSDTELGDFRRRTAALTCVAGLAGLPQVTVPFVQLAEYPVGLSLVGPPRSDERLVALAGAIARPA